MSLNDLAIKPNPPENIVPCPNCGKPIQLGAKWCPHCALRQQVIESLPPNLNDNKPWTTGQTVLVFLLLFFGIPSACLGGCFVLIMGNFVERIVLYAMLVGYVAIISSLAVLIVKGLGERGSK